MSEDNSIKIRGANERERESKSPPLNFLLKTLFSLVILVSFFFVVNSSVYAANLFSDGFETGDLTAWSSSVTDSGNLSAATEAKLNGNYGLSALINDANTIYVQDVTPNNESRYRFRFYIDPNTLPMANNDTFIIFQATSTGTACNIQLNYTTAGGYKLTVMDRADGAWNVSLSSFISDAPHYIEIDWKKATGVGANDGFIYFYVDGTLKGSNITVDNDTEAVGTVDLGQVGQRDVGTSGTLYFDDFASNNDGTVIGAFSDTSSPTGGSITYTDGYYTTASVALTVSDGTDSQSGINTSTRIVQRKSATLTNGSCGGYGSFATITTTGTYPNLTDTDTLTSGNCYQYQYLVSDNSSNQAIYTGLNTVKLDSTAPTVTINQAGGQADPTNNPAISFTVVFSEAIAPATFTSGDITTGGTTTGVTWGAPSTSDNITWTITTTAVGTDGTIIPSIGASKVTDLAGNDNTASTSTDNAVTYDSTAPTVPGTPTTTSLTTVNKPVWTWTASTDSGSGLAATPYSVQWCGNSSFTGCDANTDTATTNTYTHATTLADGTWYFRVKATDAANNSSAYSSNGTDTINTVVTTTSTSSSSSNNSSSTSTACSDQAPGAKAPWLYGAIAQDSSSVLLYFTEADNPVNKYVLEYGTKSGDYPYGVQDMGINIRGQMTYLVKSLSPNTTYYFKIRGGNGCATGTWSNEISAKTKSNVEFNQLNLTSQLEIVPVVETPPTVTKKNGKQAVATPTPTETKTQSGYDVKVKVIDTEKKPIEGATVTLHSNPQTTKTDKNGIASFKNVEAGDHKVLIAYNNFEGEQSINLTGNVKEFDLNVTVQQKAISLSPLAYGIIGIMGIVIIGLIVLLIKNKRKE